MRVRQALVPLLAGMAVTGGAFGAVALATAGDGDGTRARPSAGIGPAHPGKEVFARMTCASCHQLATAGSSGVDFAPNLDKRLAGHDEESLREQILSPAERDIMPKDFGQRMSDQQLDDLVDFLLVSRPPD